MASAAAKPPLVRFQGAIGVLLAVAIVAAWVAIHIYAMFAFQLSWVSLPLALVIAALQCWLSVGLFIVSHDAMHGSLIPRGGRVNGMIGGALLFLYAGFAWKRMRAAHFDHHRLSGKAGDPDFDEHNPHHFWRWYGTFMRRYFGWGSVLFVSSVVTLYWVVLGVPVEKIVLLYGLPAIASSLQLFYFGTYRPHTHNGAGFADRHNARSERFGVLASLASCFHFGYHHEHHRAPNTPWWALPAMRRGTLRTEAQL
ncbi:fatty acid desaturase [Qipengyuania marisflavi]|uniref:Beta-carotene ketolase n=1 Tax=Qipengyuania marisflavi TaxID=2486356 RepID=A0A5S3P0P7_9SPHN|nr:fatty acid desaturase [Qipengyuania marisflavi]TMM46229.1 beta-carotene ketolase [Qipengyuania marisflavi]